MDPELKQYLDRKFADMDGKFAAMDGKFAAIDGKFAEMDGKFATKQDLEAMGTRLVGLITEVKESLEREINTGFEEMDSRFHIQLTRLDRQAALIQTGSRWTNRMNDWAENVDIALDQKSDEIARLRRRVDKLEGGSNTN